MDLRERIENDEELSRLKERLEAIPSSYPSFVYGTIVYCIKRNGLKEQITQFLDSNSEVSPSDVLTILS